jgi:outer membrane immunogenic protein
MFKSMIPVALFVGVAVTQSPAFSQEGSGGGRSDVSVQALGSFVKTTTRNGVDQSATNSGGVLATYRFFFDVHNGVEVNYGYERNTQSYALPVGPLGVGTDSHEVSVDYVLRFPQKRWTPFVLAGVGALVFDPRGSSQSILAGSSITTGSPVAIDSQTRAAFVYGGGADFKLTKNLFMRAEYRGFVYNSPTYDYSGFSNLDRTTHRAEPSIGFGYRF